MFSDLDPILRKKSHHPEYVMASSFVHWAHQGYEGYQGPSVDSFMTGDRFGFPNDRKGRQPVWSWLEDLLPRIRVITYLT